MTEEKQLFENAVKSNLAKNSKKQEKMNHGNFGPKRTSRIQTSKFEVDGQIQTQNSLKDKYLAVYKQTLKINGLVYFDKAQHNSALKSIESCNNKGNKRSITIYRHKDYSVQKSKTIESPLGLDPQETRAHSTLAKKKISLGTNLQIPLNGHKGFKSKKSAATPLPRVVESDDQNGKHRLGHDIFNTKTFDKIVGDFHQRQKNISSRKVGEIKDFYMKKEQKVASSLTRKPEQNLGSSNVSPACGKHVSMMEIDTKRGNELELNEQEFGNKSLPSIYGTRPQTSLDELRESVSVSQLQTLGSQLTPSIIENHIIMKNEIESQLKIIDQSSQGSNESVDQLQQSNKMTMHHQKQVVIKLNNPSNARPIRHRQQAVDLIQATKKGAALLEEQVNAVQNKYIDMNNAVSTGLLNPKRGGSLVFVQQNGSMNVHAQQIMQFNETHDEAQRILAYEKKLKEKANRRKSEINNAIRNSQDYQIIPNKISAPLAKNFKMITKPNQNVIDVNGTSMPPEFINPNSQQARAHLAQINHEAIIQKNSKRTASLGVSGSVSAIKENQAKKQLTNEGIKIKQNNSQFTSNEMLQQAQAAIQQNILNTRNHNAASTNKSKSRNKSLFVSINASGQRQPTDSTNDQNQATAKCYPGQMVPISVTSGRVIQMLQQPDHQEDDPRNLEQIIPPYQAPSPRNLPDRQRFSLSVADHVNTDISVQANTGIHGLAERPNANMRSQQKHNAVINRNDLASPYRLKQIVPEDGLITPPCLKMNKVQGLQGNRNISPLRNDAAHAERLNVKPLLNTSFQSHMAQTNSNMAQMMQVECQTPNVKLQAEQITQQDIQFSYSQNKFQELSKAHPKHKVMKLVERTGDSSYLSDALLSSKNYVHPAGTAELLKAAAQQDQIVPQGSLANRFSAKIRQIPSQMSHIKVQSESNQQAPVEKQPQLKIMSTQKSVTQPTPVSKRPLKNKLPKIDQMRENQGAKKFYVSSGPHINILIQEDRCHTQHPVNKCIRMLNQFVSEVFFKLQQAGNNVNDSIPNFSQQDKEKTEKNTAQQPNMQLVNTIAKNLGISMPKNSEFRSKQFLKTCKEMMYTRLWVTLNKANGVELNFKRERFQQYKCFIGRGNNAQLLYQLFKNGRWWWTLQQTNTRADSDCDEQTLHKISSVNNLTSTANIKKQQAPVNMWEDFKEHNLIWTQWKKMRHFQYLRAPLRQSMTVTGESNFPNSRSKENQPQNLSNQLRTYAKMEANHHLSNKYALFYNMNNYYKSVGRDPFDVLPLTFHIRKGSFDKQFFKFQQVFKESDVKKQSNFTSAANSHSSLSIASKDSDKKFDKQDSPVFGKEVISIKNQHIDIERHNLTPDTMTKQRNIKNAQQKSSKTKLQRPSTKSGQLVDQKSFRKIKPIVTSTSPKNQKSKAPGKKVAPRNIWIVKPGENTNRGVGISVCSTIKEIKSIIQESDFDQSRSFIIQKYISRPQLYRNRKFDIRCFGMETLTNGKLKGYVYDDGYLRTSSKPFVCKDFNNQYIHLCNDAVQKNSPEYGRYEMGNKLSFLDYQCYLDETHSDLKIDFRKHIFSQIKQIMTDTFKATANVISPSRNMEHHTFEIYGFDFMLDEDFKVYLIEVNTNPCLETSGCTLLQKLIPDLIDSGLRMSVDPLYPPPNMNKRMSIQQPSLNLWQLSFDEDIDGPQIQELQDIIQARKNKDKSMDENKSAELEKEDQTPEEMQLVLFEDDEQEFN